MIEPHKDRRVEAIERQTRALRVDEEAKVEEAKVEHEGLERLMGGSARMSAPRSVAMNPTPHPTRSCRAPTRPCCAWSASAARASTRSTAWSRHSSRASSSSRSTPTSSLRIERGHHPAHRL